MRKLLARSFELGIVVILFGSGLIPATATDQKCPENLSPLPVQVANSNRANSKLALPDPTLPTVGQAPISLDVGSRYGDPVPNAARRMAQNVAAALNVVSATLQNNASRIANLGARLAELSGEIQAVAAQKARVMAEYARGYFCSQCHRSKSEIEEQEHEDFFAHLRRVHGTIVPATPQQTADKEREFNDKMASLEAEKAAASRESDQLETKNREAQEQFHEGVGLWYGAVQAEPDFIYANSRAIDAKAQSEFREAQQHLYQIGVERGRLATADCLTKDRVELLNQEADTWEQVRGAAQSTLTQNSDRLSSELATAQENKTREWAQITNALQQVSGVSQIHLPTMNKTLSLKDLDKNLPDYEFSVSTGANHLGGGFKLGEWVSGGIDVTTSSTEMNTQAFWALADTVRGQAGVVTSSTPEGLTIRNTGGVSTPLGNLDLSPNLSPPKTTLPCPSPPCQ
jgi:hypothetical protein